MQQGSHVPEPRSKKAPSVPEFGKPKTSVVLGEVRSTPVGHNVTVAAAGGARLSGMVPNHGSIKGVQTGWFSVSSEDESSEAAQRDYKDLVARKMVSKSAKKMRSRAASAAASETSPKFVQVRFATVPAVAFHLWLHFPLSSGSLSICLSICEQELQQRLLDMTTELAEARLEAERLK